MNIPALESLDDVRQIALLGAAFNGEDGREYIRLLTDTAWWEEPEHAALLGRALDVAEAKRGNLMDTDRRPDRPDAHQ